MLNDYFMKASMRHLSLLALLVAATSDAALVGHWKFTWFDNYGTYTVFANEVPGGPPGETKGRYSALVLRTVTAFGSSTTSTATLTSATITTSAVTLQSLFCSNWTEAAVLLYR